MLGGVWVTLFLLSLVSGLAAQVWTLVVIGALGLLVTGLAYLWSRVSLEGLEYQRSLSQRRVFAGEEVQLSVALSNRKAVPLASVQVEDDLPEGLELPEKELQLTSRPDVLNLAHATPVAAHERVRWSYTMRCTRRGHFRLGPALMRTGDLFGFFPRTKEVVEQEYILVFPKTVQLPELEIPALRVLGHQAGTVRLYQDPARPAGVRDYQPGDTLKSVDWKATARRGSLQVRIFEPGASRLLAVFLNVDTVGVPWGGFIPHNLERAVTVAASVARDALAAELSVGLYTNAKSVQFERPMKVAPGRHPEQLTLIFEALAMVGPFVAAPFEALLASEVRRLPAGTTPVLVTAIMTPGLAEALVGFLRRGWRPLMLWVADWEPEGLPEGVVCRNLSDYLAKLEQADVATA